MTDIAALGLSVRSDGVVVATKRLRELEGQSRRTEGATDRVGRSAMRAAAGFAAMAAATMGFGAIISTLSGFEKSMAAVAAITRATDMELKALRETAKALGATTEYTASQAADALKFFGMAGWSAAQSMEAIPAILDLATAAQMDLAQAADISSNIMQAFGISAANAASAADTLSAVSSRANTDVVQLGDGMKYVGPVAAALGISMGEAAAAMGALSDAGIQGSMAGTGLRRVLSSLANPTKEAAGVIAGLGLSMDDLNPSANSIVDIVQRLKDAGIDAADALTIFGDRGGPAILALVENNEKLARLTSEMSNVDGEAKRMADTMRNQLGGDIKGLMSALEGIIIQLGESGLTNALRSVVQGFTAFVRALTDVVRMAASAVSGLVEMTGISNLLGNSVDGLGGIFDDLRGYIIAAAVGATLYFSPAIIGATGAVIGFIFQLGLLKGALIATGIGAAVVAAGFLINKFLDLSEAVGGFRNAMEYAYQLGIEVWERLQLGAGAMWERMKATAGGIRLAFAVAFGAILTEFAKMLNIVTTGLADLLLKAGQGTLAAAVLSAGSAVNATVGMLNEATAEAVRTQAGLVAMNSAAADQMMRDALKPLTIWQAMSDVIDAARQKALAEGGAVPALPGIADEGGGLGALDGLDEKEKYIETIKREVEELGRLKEALRQGDEAYAAMAETIEIENVLREQKLDPLSEEGKAVAELVRQYNYLAGAIETVQNADLGGLSESDRTRSRERFEDLGKDLRGGLNDPLQALREEYAERLKIVDDFEKAYTGQTEEAERMRALIREQYAEAQRQTMVTALGTAFADVANVMRKGLGEQSALYKAALVAQQAAAIASATMSMNVAIGKAMEVGWPANIALIAQAISSGTQIIGAIQNIATGFQDGGFTGMGGVSQVAGVVHGQEFVAHAEATKRWRPQLEAMNAGTYRPANDNAGSGRIAIDVNVSVDDDGRLQAYVTQGMNEAVNASVTISDQRTKAQMGAAAKDARRPVISARG